MTSARPDLLYRQLYEQFSVGRIRLAGCVLSRVTLECEGKLAYTWVEVADFDRCGARPVDTEDLVNECLKIGGTQCAFIAVEQLNKTVKFSFRSRAAVDVAALAEQFGGGGHKQASGATLNGNLADATQARADRHPRSRGRPHGTARSRCPARPCMTGFRRSGPAPLRSLLDDPAPRFNKLPLPLIKLTLRPACHDCCPPTFTSSRLLTSDSPTRTTDHALGLCR